MAAKAPTPTPTTPSLYEDIYSQIIRLAVEDAFLHNCRLPTLARLALVSKTFLFLVRPILWGSLQFKTAAISSSPAEGAVVTSNILDRSITLAQNPNVGELVHQVRWRISVSPHATYLPKFNRELTRFESVLRSSPNLSKLYLVGGFRLGSVFEVMTASGVNLSELRVEAYRESEGLQYHEWLGKFSMEGQVSLMRLLAGQNKLRLLEVHGVDSGLEWPPEFAPTFSLVELEVNVKLNILEEEEEMEDSDDEVEVEDFVPYAADNFISKALSHSWTTLRCLTACLPNSAIFSHLPVSTTFTSLAYVELYWREGARINDGLNNPLDDLSSLLARCPILSTLYLSGGITKQEVSSKSYLASFITNFPSSVRYLTFKTKSERGSFDPTFILPLLQQTSAHLHTLQINLEYSEEWRDAEMKALRAICTQKMIELEPWDG